MSKGQLLSLFFAEEFGEVPEGAIVDIHGDSDPHTVAAHKYQPKVLEFQVTVKCWGPSPVLWVNTVCNAIL